MYDQHTDTLCLRNLLDTIRENRDLFGAGSGASSLDVIDRGARPPDPAILARRVSPPRPHPNVSTAPWPRYDRAHPAAARPAAWRRVLGAAARRDRVGTGVPRQHPRLGRGRASGINGPHLRADRDAYDGLVAAYERVRVVTTRTAADGWRQWVAYALAEDMMRGGVGPEVPDSVLALTNEWLAAWGALDDAVAEADALLAAA